MAAWAQTATIQGKVTSIDQKPVPFATVMLKGTPFGTSSSLTGDFKVEKITPGNYSLRVTGIGYKPHEQKVGITADSILNITIKLEESAASLNEVVVTGTRTSRRRLESPVAVNVLDSKTFGLTQSTTLSEGLCFQPGLRVETDCQTCNYTQLRMNGLGGAYSQVLINSRPVFTSLMSLYGLEQIPANMIDRVEIVRGGGSVLYGSSAIAGTVNIITKEPQESSYSIATNSAVIEGQAWDHILNANLNVVSENGKSGVSFFGARRNKEAYDANGDGFSELAQLKNNSFGFNSFFKLNERGKLEINGWSIYENRHGGNRLDKPADQADQSEYRLHHILLGGFNYDHVSPNGKNSYSIYGSAQNTDRTHYTGIDGQNGWGTTDNHTIQGGFQYNYTSGNFLGGSNTFTFGAEHQYDYTFDEIEAYDYLIDQRTHLTGMFLQSDWNVTPALTLLSGIRTNKHNYVDKLILTPRLSALYKLGTTTQLRASYALGFRAPQAFEADMHIAFAGGGISRIQIDPALKEETSNSYNLSLDFNKANEAMIYGFTVDGFYNRLYNAFILEKIGKDKLDNQLLLRKNGSNSTVKGITLESRLNCSQLFQLEAGVTFQNSKYDSPVAWSASVTGTRNYLRTPNTYGYYVLSLLPQRSFTAAFSGVLTGPMQIPHFAGAPGVTEDELTTSQTIWENNLKLAYRFTLKSIQQDLQLHLGVQNILNEYQQDFDIGKNRDSNYVYGPARPRTFFLGMKFGLM
ncbi:TonB-dependent receptor [Pontibacter harenae]|uniref:TonB-dependent receptor n=1 Tax=Pontibacter harenae TaxID=2894083 RepID=UPI001E4ED32E|nr:TonB-dependent receptor [Pontibacter harenae]MCC9165555.1 TonB-dependent receptor [Pontibacter harenae]